jgi:hypothetical protein
MSNNNPNLSANTNVVELTQAELNSVTGGIIARRDRHGRIIPSPFVMF